MSDHRDDESDKDSSNRARTLAVLAGLHSAGALSDEELVSATARALNRGDGDHDATAMPVLTAAAADPRQSRRLPWIVATMLVLVAAGTIVALVARGDPTDDRRAEIPVPRPSSASVTSSPSASVSGSPSPANENRAAPEPDALPPAVISPTDVATALLAAWQSSDPGDLSEITGGRVLRRLRRIKEAGLPVSAFYFGGCEDQSSGVHRCSYFLDEPAIAVELTIYDEQYGPVPEKVKTFGL